MHQQAVVCIHEVHTRRRVLEGQEEDALGRLLEGLQRARAAAHGALERVRGDADTRQRLLHRVEHVRELDEDDGPCAF